MEKLHEIERRVEAYVPRRLARRAELIVAGCHDPRDPRGVRHWHLHCIPALLAGMITQP